MRLLTWTLCTSFHPRTVRPGFARRAEILVLRRGPTCHVTAVCAVLAALRRGWERVDTLGVRSFDLPLNIAQSPSKPVRQSGRCYVHHQRTHRFVNRLWPEQQTSHSQQWEAGRHGHKRTRHCQRGSVVVILGVVHFTSKHRDPSVGLRMLEQLTLRQPILWCVVVGEVNSSFARLQTPVAESAPRVQTFPTELAARTSLLVGSGNQLLPLWQP